MNERMNEEKQEEEEETTASHCNVIWKNTSINVIETRIKK